MKGYEAGVYRCLPHCHNPRSAGGSFVIEPLLTDAV